MSNLFFENIPDGWHVYPLADVASSASNSFVDGPFGSNLKVSDYVESGVRVIQLQNIGDGFFIDDHKIYINTNKSKSLKRCMSHPGDIVVAKMADPLARAAILPKKYKNYIIVADLIRIKISEKFNTFFITCVINSNSFRNEAERVSTGTTRRRISLSQLKRIPFIAPSLLDQQIIADILTTLDNLIDHTESLIAKYQSIKQGMMHDLFTRGVDAKGRLRPPREEAPELYKESALGWIPREWEAKPLKSILKRSPQNGYSPKEVDEWMGIYVLGLGCLTVNGFQPLQLKYAPAHAILRQDAFLFDGDILVSRSNTIELVGLVGRYKDIGEICIYPDLMMRIVPSDCVDPFFLELSLMNSSSRDQIRAFAQGTSVSMVKINADNLLNLFIRIPSKDEQFDITTKLSVIMKNILAAETNLYKYRNIKSGLMHDLLTGTVRIPPHLATAQEPPHAL